MARQWRLFHGRVQLFLRRSLSLFLLAMMGLLVSLGLRLLQPASAYQPKMTGENIAVTANNFNPNAWLFASNSSVAQSDLLQQGVAAYQQGNFSGAEELWKKAVAEFQQQGNWLNQALTLNYLSLAVQQLGDLGLAGNYINQSENSLAKVAEGDSATEALGDRAFVQAKILNTKGRLQLLQGNAESALATWQQAEAVYTQLKDAEAIAGIQINQAQALQSLGQYRQALKTLQKIEADIASKPQEIQFHLLLALGNAYVGIGDVENAKNHLESAKSKLEKIGQSHYPQALSNVWLSLGNLERIKGDRKRDLLYTDEVADILQLQSQKNHREFYQKALEDYQQATNNAGSPIAKLSGQLNQINLLSENYYYWSEAAKKYKSNQPQFLSAIAEQIEELKSSVLDTLNQNNIPLGQTAIYSRINLAQSLLHLHESSANPQLVPEIEKLLADAGNLARELSDRRAEADVLGEFGQLYTQIPSREYVAKAESFTNQALAISQSIKASDMAYKWQWQLGKLLKKQGNVKEAINAYQAAVNNLDIVRQKYLVGLDFSLNDASSNKVKSDRQFYFREQVEPVYREFIDLLLSQPEDSEQNNLYQALGTIELFQVAELENFLRCSLTTAALPSAEQSKKDSLNFANKSNQSKDVEKSGLFRAVENASAQVKKNLAQIFNQVDPTVAAIYPSILDDRIDVIIAQKGKPLHHSRSQSISRTETLQELELLQRYLETSYNFENAQRLSSQLYQKLLAQAIAANYLNPSDIKTLLFVLDTPLRNIPMAALYDGKQYLIEKYAVALNTSLVKRNTEFKNLKKLQQVGLNALVAGLGKAPDDRRYEQLYFVGEEINQIQKYLNLPAGSELIDENFTASNLQTKIESAAYNVIHIATHGQFQSNPKGTFILAGQDSSTEKGDRIPVKYLDVDELDGLVQLSSQTNPIELLVLSACETAAGDNRAALGLAGVAARGGARSTIASLWSLNDKSTAYFMGKFYQKLANAQKNTQETRAEILRSVQQEFLQDPRYKHPVYWSPYILLGNWL